MGTLQLIDRTSCVLGCGSPLKEKFRLGKFTIVTCPVCQIVYRSPYLTSEHMQSLYENSKSLGEMFPHFEGYFDCCENPETDSATKRSYLRWLDHLEKLAPAKDILDVGCGRGLFLKLAKDKGWKTKGVDFSEENVHFAKETYQLDVEQKNFFELKTSDRYSVISLWDVLEHAEDPYTLLLRCHELLKENGMLIAALPHEKSAYNDVAAGIYKLSMGKSYRLVDLLYPAEHLTYYSKESTQKIFNRTNFKIEEIIFENSDLSRIQVSPLMRAGMMGLNLVSTLLNKKTRLIVMARKRTQ